MKAFLKKPTMLIILFSLIMGISFSASSGQKYASHLFQEKDTDPSRPRVAQNVLPNLRFGSINVHSRTGTYEIIAFKEYDYSVTLFSDSTGAKNVRVRAGIENGKVFYDKTFSYISKTTPRRITFSYTMPIGTHTMVIDVDPDNTIKEFNESDNRTTRTFTANLRIDVR